MQNLAAQIIIQILTEEMCVKPDRIWLRDENRKIPDDKDLFIIVGLVDAKVITNTVFMQSETVDTVTTQHQISQVQQREMIQIDLMSRSPEAKFRNWEAIAALQSFYSQQQQELNNFKIFRNPEGPHNTSAAEGGSNINRYTVLAPCFVWYYKDKLMNSPLGDYYDDFTQTVRDDITDPLFEFEITPETPPPP